MRIVAGRFRGKTILAPVGRSVRPTPDRVREAIFSIIGSRLGPDFADVAVLDLFAGTGAMGLEALSRGAGSCVFVDSGAEARALLRENIERFGVAGSAKLLRRDACALGPAGSLGPFDLVFADPPYGEGLGGRALHSAAHGGWLAEDALVVLEERKDADVALPAGFEIVDRRTYGDTQVLLLTASSGPAATGGARR